MGMIEAKTSGDMCCSICNTKFNLDREPGLSGYIGILPFCLCQLCFHALEDMFEELILERIEASG